MSTGQNLTAEQFQILLEEGNRWIELAFGRLLRFEPPDEAHGNVVYQLSRALGRLIKPEAPWYACFEVGLLVAEQPDSVRCPAVSLYPVAQRFSLTDQLVTRERPRLIIEIASTTDRREGTAERLEQYRQWRVPEVWVIDAVSQHLHHHVHPVGDSEEAAAAPSSRSYRAPETFRATHLLPGWEFQVADLFAEPEWMRRSRSARPETTESREEP